MLSKATRAKTTQRLAALALGAMALGTPLVSFAQAPPPRTAQASRPTTPPSPSPPPPNAQPGQPAYSPPPDGYPPGAYPPPQREPPPTLPYGEDWPIPPGYSVVKRARTGLVIGGAFTFGVPYFFTALVGAFSLNSNEYAAEYGPLLVPVVGPFIVIGTGNFTSSRNLPRLVAIALSIDGVIQAGGVAMVVAGIVSKKKLLVRDSVAAAMQPEFFVGPGSVSMKMQF